MSIFNQQTQNIPTVEQSISAIKFTNTRLVETMKLSVSQAFNLVWNNQNYTPQQVLDGFGTSAATLFQASSDIQTLILKYDPTFVPLTPPTPVTFNQDGTVTVTSTP